MSFTVKCGKKHVLETVAIKVVLIFYNFLNYIVYGYSNNSQTHGHEPYEWKINDAHCFLCLTGDQMYSSAFEICGCSAHICVSFVSANNDFTLLSFKLVPTSNLQELPDGCWVVTCSSSNKCLS